LNYTIPLFVGSYRVQQAKFDTVSCSNFDAKARRSTGCPPPEARLQDFGKSHRQCQESHLKVEKMAKVAASSGDVFRTPPGGLSQIIASFCTTPATPVYQW
jgi:hypothetical protein